MIVLLAFSFLPLVEGFMNHQHTQSVASIKEILGHLIVGTSDGIVAVSFHQFHFPFFGTVDGGRLPKVRYRDVRNPLSASSTYHSAESLSQQKKKECGYQKEQISYHTPFRLRKGILPLYKAQGYLLTITQGFLREKDVATGVPSESITSCEVENTSFPAGEYILIPILPD